MRTIQILETTRANPTGIGNGCMYTMGELHTVPSKAMTEELADIMIRSGQACEIIPGAQIPLHGMETPASAPERQPQPNQQSDTGTVAEGNALAAQGKSRRRGPQPKHTR